MTTTLVLALLVATLTVYWFPVRRFFRHWGATPFELARRMPGDARVPWPTFESTLAVTIDATPLDIWPWLAQMGNGRGGLYSYDWLDRKFGYLDRASETRVLPQFQHVKVGDVIPVGRGPGFPVAAVDAGRSLVLSGSAGGSVWEWQFGLYPIDTLRTRLVSRNSAQVPPTIKAWLLLRVLEPAAFLMTRRMLLGIAQRSESLAKSRRRAARRVA